MHVLRPFEDVTSISWIFVLFACFVALIEVGCYKLVLEPWSVLSRLKPGHFPCCMRHVREYCWYLLCCSVLLGRSESSGGEAYYFRSVLVWQGWYDWLRRLSWLWFVLRFLSILSWILFASLKESSEKRVGDLPVVQEFL